MAAGSISIRNEACRLDGFGLVVPGIISTRYLMVERDIMYAEQKTPDGYYVDESGKWIKDPKNEEHTHKWVEETETVNHPEESHIEIKHHDAVTHTVNHDEEFHYETVNHPEESHMETVHHEEVGHYVHHDAEGYYNTVHHDEISHREYTRSY